MCRSTLVFDRLNANTFSKISWKDKQKRNRCYLFDFSLFSSLAVLCWPMIVSNWISSDMDSSVILNDSLSQLNSILSSTKEEYLSNRSAFFSEEKISSLGKYISIVTDLYHSLQLTKIDQLKDYFSNPSFSDLRRRWDEFLAELDENPVISSSNPRLMPSKMELFSVNENQSVDIEQLYSNDDRTLFVFLRHLAWLPWREHVQLLKNLVRCHIVIISFTSSIESIRQWKEETQCSFPIYLNSDRSLYRYLTFPNNAYARVWNIQTLDYYVEQKIAGKSLPKKLDENDDPHQMGGNVLVNRTGEILFFYRSQTPTDRPSLEQLQAF